MPASFEGAAPSRERCAAKRQASSSAAGAVLRNHACGPRSRAWAATWGSGRLVSTTISHDARRRKGRINARPSSPAKFTSSTAAWGVADRAPSSMPHEACRPEDAMGMSACERRTGGFTRSRFYPTSCGRATTSSGCVRCNQAKPEGFALIDPRQRLRATCSGPAFRVYRSTAMPLCFMARQRGATVEPRRLEHERHDAITHLGTVGEVSGLMVALLEDGLFARHANGLRQVQGD